MSPSVDMTPSPTTPLLTTFDVKYKYKKQMTRESTLDMKVMARDSSIVNLTQVSTFGSSDFISPLSTVEHHADGNQRPIVSNAYGYEQTAPGLVYQISPTVDTVVIKSYDEDETDEEEKSMVPYEKVGPDYILTTVQGRKNNGSVSRGGVRTPVPKESSLELKGFDEVYDGKKVGPEV